MKLEIDMDELVGLMLDNKLFEEVMCELHPEFMGTLEKKLQFLKDIVRAGRSDAHFARAWFTQEELEEVPNTHGKMFYIHKGESNE